MKLTIHRGTHEIGGSCLELATPGTRIILDVGMPLVDADREPFDSRSALGKAPEELIRDGTLPRVSELFDQASRPPDAILLSHAHLDHSGLLPFSRAETPIYTSKGTSKMMLAAAVFGGQAGLDPARYREVIPKRPFRVGDFRITPLAVDHSIVGSVAFLARAEGKTILYSGDLRAHGRKPGMARTLLEEIAGGPIDVLVMEGTHFGSENERGISEYELEEQIVGHVRTASALVLACFSPLDVDRLVTYYRAARRSGRTFVVDAYAAFVLHLIASQINVPRPTRDKGVRVYFNRAFQRRNLESLSQTFHPDRIALDEILHRPQEHLMLFRPSMTGLDFGGQLPPRRRCVYSYWEGYLTRPDWAELQRQVAAVGGDFIPAHVSGHIYIADLVKFVNAVNARTVIPIHTFEPGEFRKRFANALLLDDGRPVEV